MGARAKICRNPVKPGHRLIATETNPQVNREMAITLSVIKDRGSIADGWAELARKHDGKDRWYLEALGIDDGGASKSKCLDAWLKVVSSGWNTAAGRDIIWRLRSAKQRAPYLAKILADFGTTDVDAPRYLREFDFIPASPEKTKALIQLVGLGLRKKMVATEALQRLKNIDLSGNEELQHTIKTMLEASKGTAQFVDLVRDFKLQGSRASGLLRDRRVKALSSPEGVEGGQNAPRIGVRARSSMASALEVAESPTPSRKPSAPSAGSSARSRFSPTSLAASASEDIAAPRNAKPSKSLAQSPAGRRRHAQARPTRRDFPADLKLTATNTLAAVQLPQWKAEIARAFPVPNALGGQALPPIAELVKMKGDAEHLAKPSLLPRRNDVHHLPSRRQPRRRFRPRLE